MASSFNVVKNKANRIPAVVHVDGTLRPQFVSKETSLKYHKLINEFFKNNKCTYSSKYFIQCKR